MCVFAFNDESQKVLMNQWRLRIYIATWCHGMFLSKTPIYSMVVSPCQTRDEKNSSNSGLNSSSWSWTALPQVIQMFFFFAHYFDIFKAAYHLSQDRRCRSLTGRIWCLENLFLVDEGIELRLFQPKRYRWTEPFKRRLVLDMCFFPFDIYVQYTDLCFLYMNQKHIIL